MMPRPHYVSHSGETPRVSPPRLACNPQSMLDGQHRCIQGVAQISRSSHSSWAATLIGSSAMV
eukprot:9645540-Lingulodinium_polyedra.AAC.1